MNGPEIQKSILLQFWKLFGDRRKHGVGFTMGEKLEALKDLSLTAIPYNTQTPLEHRREKFNVDKPKLHPFRRFGICFVCGNTATDRHHIIQLKNGGINSRKNLVSLCYGCHKQIHPWMKMAPWHMFQWWYNSHVLIPVPSWFVQVEPETFYDYLNWCEDYTSQCNANVRVYTFRHGHRFAYEDREGRVFVDPKLLKPHEHWEALQAGMWFCGNGEEGEQIITSTAFKDYWNRPHQNSPHGERNRCDVQRFPCSHSLGVEEQSKCPLMTSSTKNTSDPNSTLSGNNNADSTSSFSVSKDHNQTVLTCWENSGVNDGNDSVNQTTKPNEYTNNKTTRRFSVLYGRRYVKRRSNGTSCWK